jgi:phenylalanyl-tRNA synthetase beta chain
MPSPLDSLFFLNFYIFARTKQQHLRLRQEDNMKISYNWLKSYLDIDLPAERVGEILTSIGLELEGLETYESVQGGLAGLVVGRVLECAKHPDADRLSLTKVDIGNGQPLEIVCGAPNVAAGQKVVVATIGATLYPESGEPFTIKKGKIRGATSEGMICAEDEIGLGKSHEGIMVLSSDAPVGIPAADYFNIERDSVFEIGLTPNRSDANCHLGVAADLAAALRINHRLPVRLNLPSVEQFKIDSHDLPIKVRVENTAACPRYTGIAIKGVAVGESPEWLKNRLRAIGQRPINNIVDITNFVLHEYGQPLHAFDADKIGGGQVVVKNLPEGTKFLALDGTERTLSNEDLMICDGEGKGMCIAGVFGGIDSGVTNQTRNVFLESAWFAAKPIRRTSSRHLLRTDAARAFEKGVDPNNCLTVLKRAADLIRTIAGGEIASEPVDVYPTPVHRPIVDLHYNKIHGLIGADISKEEVKQILNALEIEVLAETVDGLRVAVPTNKVDVLREVDVIEEILRIHGFDRVPVPSQVRSALTYSPKPNRSALRNSASNYLSDNGFNEMMNLSISQSKYYKNILPFDESALVFINNTSNVHLDVMRPSMLVSGLEAIRYNQNRQNPDLRLYEFGKCYWKGEAGFEESERFALFLTGQRHEESWHQHSANGKGEVSFYTMKAYVNQLLAKLGATDFQEHPIEPDGGVFSYGLRYHRGQQVLAELGKVQGRILKAMDIKSAVFYADLQWDNILKALAKNKVEYREMSKFPSMRRDLALVLDANVAFASVVQLARRTERKLLKDINLFDVYEDEARVGAGKKSYAISFLFEDNAKTLQDKEVDKVMDRLMDAYEKTLGAAVRR